MDDRRGAPNAWRGIAKKSVDVVLNVEIYDPDLWTVVTRFELDPAVDETKGSFKMFVNSDERTDTTRTFIDGVEEHTLTVPFGTFGNFTPAYSSSDEWVAISFRANPPVPSFDNVVRFTIDPVYENGRVRLNFTALNKPQIDKTTTFFAVDGVQSDIDDGEWVINTLLDQGTHTVVCHVPQPWSTTDTFQFSVGKPVRLVLEAEHKNGKTTISCSADDPDFDVNNLVRFSINSQSAFHNIVSLALSPGTHPIQVTSLADPTEWAVFWDPPNFSVSVLDETQIPPVPTVTLSLAATHKNGTTSVFCIANNQAFSPSRFISFDIGGTQSDSLNRITKTLPVGLTVINVRNAAPLLDWNVQWTPKVETSSMEESLALALGVTMALACAISIVWKR